MTTADTTARLREVQEKIRARTNDDFGRLVVLADELSGGKTERLPEVQRIAHRIAGSASLFGSADLGTAARQLDDLLVARPVDPVLMQNSLDALLQKLREMFAERQPA
jgi:HPt (histidine-containing phosphotransfer) domain-containing protein